MPCGNIGIGCFTP
ncbi:hypothetical protein L0990_08550 [Vibrio kanaloae]|nr:hypothetical protein LWM38_16150 [Vibrio kanaloae]